MKPKPFLFFVSAFLFGSVVLAVPVNGDLVSDLLSSDPKHRKAGVDKVNAQYLNKMSRTTEQAVVKDYRSWRENIRAYYDRYHLFVRQEWDDGDEEHMRGNIDAMNRFQFTCAEPRYWAGNKDIGVSSSLAEITCGLGDFHITLISWKENRDQRPRNGYIVGDKAVPVSILGIYDLDQRDDLEFYIEAPYYEGEGTQVSLLQWKRGKFVPFR